MSTEKELAASLFDRGFLCSQAVLAAWSGRFSLDLTTALKLASGLGAGMGCMAKECGAVTGAYLVLGLAAGYADPEDNRNKVRVFAMVRTFSERFKALHGTTVCSELLGLDISNPGQYAAAKEQGLFTTRCPIFVTDAVSILEDFLAGKANAARSK